VNNWPQNLWIVLIGFGCAVVFGWVVTKGWFQQVAKTGRRAFLRGVVSLGLGLLFAGGGVTAWYYLRPQPTPITQELFPGITYVREVRKEPRPVVIHIVTVDLTTAGLSFLVTPGKAGEKKPLSARTTREFAREFHTQVALNGDYFSPWVSNTPWDYYPRSGDPVGVHGIAASRGVQYTEGERKWDAPTLYLSKDNRPSLLRPTNEVYNAISGNIFLMREGKRGPDPIPEKNSLEPRTAIGFDKDGTKLIMVAVDGRQPRYSEGMNYDELVELLVQLGAFNAINLDGGGSTTLVAETRKGRWTVLNSPAHTRVPGRERPVANHLGVYFESR
jgi:hypothetical protein